MKVDKNAAATVTVAELGHGLRPHSPAFLLKTMTATKPFEAHIDGRDRLLAAEMREAQAT